MYIRSVRPLLPFTTFITSAFLQSKSHGLDFVLTIFVTISRSSLLYDLVTTSARSASPPSARPSCHQQPQVNYLPCFENGDLPCRLHVFHVVWVNHHSRNRVNSSLQVAGGELGEEFPSFQETRNDAFHNVFDLYHPFHHLHNIDSIFMTFGDLDNRCTTCMTFSPTIRWTTELSSNIN